MTDTVKNSVDQSWNANGKIPMMPDLLSYGLLLAGLAALGVNEVWAFRRMEAKK